MANKKISELTAGAATLLPTSVLPAVEASATKKWTRREVIRLALATPLTGAANTLALGHAWQRVDVDHTADTTVTVPPNSSVAFEIGDEIELWQVGAGQLIVAEGAGVTINKPDTLKARKQWSVIRLVKVDTNTWRLYGDVEVLP
jgi:hypothetical protein